MRRVGKVSADALLARAEDELGSTEEEHQRSDQQGQRVEHQDARSRGASLLHPAVYRAHTNAHSQLFGENLIRGRGLFVRSVMRAQASSLPFTPIFASLVAIVNTKLPQVGELLLNRLISQFRRSYKRNDKVRSSPSALPAPADCRPQPTMTATTTFIAHLVNQQVAHEILALQVLVLLLERPTDDSVEIAVSFMREVGAFLAETSPKANNGVYERFRAILHESGIDKRVQYMVEVLFQVRKDKYKDNPVIPEGLDLVEEEDAITHKISLDDELQVHEMLSAFFAPLLVMAVRELMSDLQTCSSLTPSTLRTRTSTRRSRQRFWATSRTRTSRATRGMWRTRAMRSRTMGLVSCSGSLVIAMGADECVCLRRGGWDGRCA